MIEVTTPTPPSADASAPQRVTLDLLRGMKAAGRKFAMLTAYDHPTAVAAQQAGVHSLLVGDSMGCVVLGHENTRGVPLDLMITLASAVRRGAPAVWLVGDLPFVAMSSLPQAIHAAQRYVQDAGCDAVKLEVTADHADWVREMSRGGLTVVAHLGLRPQSVRTPAEYRAQARDAAGVADLAQLAAAMQSAGAAAILLEAVPNEAAAAVVEAVSVPVIGCGAGAACDGHVVVTHDLLGFTHSRPPRFVPVLAHLHGVVRDAMRQYVDQIADRTYPAPHHAYGMRPG